jgi:hypothetical protein
MAHQEAAAARVGQVKETANQPNLGWTCDSSSPAALELILWIYGRSQLRTGLGRAGLREISKDYLVIRKR